MDPELLRQAMQIGPAGKMELKHQVRELSSQRYAVDVQERCSSFGTLDDRKPVQYAARWQGYLARLGE